MAVDEERLTALVTDIRRALPARDSFNLVIVTVPPADAVRTGRLLCGYLSCGSLDYDAKVLELMAAGNWDLYLTRERTKMRQPVHRVFKQAASEAAGTVCPETPLVVYNINLPATWDYPDFGNDFYQLSSGGLVILVVGGSANAQIRLHHHLVVSGAALAQSIDLSS